MAADTAPAPAFTASLNTYTSIAGEERMLVPILKVYSLASPFTEKAGWRD